jgi:hypothetical protein
MDEHLLTSKYMDWVPPSQYLVSTTKNRPYVCPKVNLKQDRYLPDLTFVRQEAVAVSQKPDWEIPGRTSAGVLALGCAEQTYTANFYGFSFLLDLTNVKQLVPKMLNLKKLVSKGKSAFVDLADYASGEYLKTIYGILPTASDFQLIAKAMARGHKTYYDKNSYLVFSSGHSTPGFKASGCMYYSIQRLKMAFSQIDGEFDTVGSVADWSNVQTDLESVGFGNFCSSLWDRVPWSFVVDWFINYGDYFMELDLQDRVRRLPLRYCTESEKIICNKNIDYHGFTGNLSACHYFRWTYDTYPVVVPQITTIFDSGSFSHWYESGALCVQMRRK